METKNGIESMRCERRARRIRNIITYTLLCIVSFFAVVVGNNADRIKCCVKWPELVVVVVVVMATVQVPSRGGWKGRRRVKG